MINKIKLYKYIYIVYKINVIKYLNYKINYHNHKSIIYHLLNL